MRNKKNIILFCSVLALIILAFPAATAYGNEGIGGQVNTGGKISFYDEVDIPDKPAPIVPEKPTTSTDAKPNDVEKPKGKLPNTGEKVKRYGVIGLGLILLSLMFLLLRKKEANR